MATSVYYINVPTNNKTSESRLISGLRREGALCCTDSKTPQAQTF